MGNHSSHERNFFVYTREIALTKRRMRELKASFSVSDTPAQRNNKSTHLKSLTSKLRYAQYKLSKLEDIQEENKPEANQLMHKEAVPANPNIPTL